LATQLALITIGFSQNSNSQISHTQSIQYLQFFATSTFSQSKNKISQAVKLSFTLTVLLPIKRLTEEQSLHLQNITKIQTLAE
jgi:hypothetical protein